MYLTFRRLIIKFNKQRDIFEMFKTVTQFWQFLTRQKYKKIVHNNMYNYTRDTSWYPKINY